MLSILTYDGQFPHMHGSRSLTYCLIWDQIAGQQQVDTMARGPLDLWNEWATQILVLLSLTLQVVLLLLAGIRRREASPVPTFFLWLAYQLADSTAIYAVGHLSLSNVPVKHQLVAFWAPFLLLHLGVPTTSPPTCSRTASSGYAIYRTSSCRS